jgi:hypothetical protein
VSASDGRGTTFLGLDEDEGKGREDVAVELGRSRTRAVVEEDELVAPAPMEGRPIMLRGRSFGLADETEEEEEAGAAVLPTRVTLALTARGGFMLPSSATS